jgi:23S rRNA (pseudouridine1915-N3)-methyltransferase
MDIKILAVGKIKDRSYAQKIEEYTGRIRHDARLEIVEIRDSDRETEATRILDICGRERADIYALVERGKLFSSLEFARTFTAVPRRIVFIIGGPCGLSERIVTTARACVSLSPLTFPHEIARLLLLEQIYRAISITKGRKYHK